MKKLLFFSVLLALLAACAKPELEIVPESVAGADNQLPKVVKASINNEQDDSTQTRTYIDDNLKVLWNKGDCISFFYVYNSNAMYTYNGESGVSDVTFDKVNDGDGSYSLYFTHAIYPYSESNTSTPLVKDVSRRLAVTYPATQIYAPNSFGQGANLMVGKGDKTNNTNINFRNAGGCLVIKLYGNTVVKNIKLTALGEGVKIAGAGHIDIDVNGNLAFGMESNAVNEITLDCSQYNDGQGVALSTDKDNPTEFWFALPPVTMTGGMKITVTEVNGTTFEKQTTKDVVIERNKIQPMKAFDYTLYQLVYTTSDGNKIDFSHLDEEDWGPFNADIVSHTFEDGKGVIILSEPLTSINEKAFYFKRNLASILLPNTLVNIDKQAFYAAEFPEITIPGSVNYIGEDAFTGCIRINSITFLPSPTNTPLRFGENTHMTKKNRPFYSCKALTSIHLNRELIYVDEDGNDFQATHEGDGIFYHDVNDYRENLSVTFGEQVTYIPAYMFYATPIRFLTIPATITKIGEYAFYDCDKMATITIESSSSPLVIVENGNGPFYYSPLTIITLDRELVYQDEDGDAFVADSWSEGIFAHNSYDEVGSVTVNFGPNVKTIHSYMFSSLPISNPFNNATNVTTVGEGAFSYNTALTSLTIPNTVTTIGKAAFRDNENLTSITISGSVNSIKVDAFYNCESLKSITFNQSDTPLMISRAIDPDGTSDLSPFYYSPLETITVNRELKYVNPDDSHFTPDSWDEGLFVHKYYESIEEMSVTLGGSFKTISGYMFNYMPIKEITIPSSVTMIDNFAFDECKKLSRIIFSQGSNPLTIGFQPGTDETGPFFDSPLTYIKLDRPLYLTSEYNYALDAWDEGVFAYDYWDDDDLNLTTTVSLGDNVNYIYKYMFSGVRMTGCWIPKNVTKIDYRAFHDCEHLQSLSLGSTTPPTLGDQVFDDCDVFKTIYVPKNYQNTYKTNSQWKEVIDDHGLYVYYWAGSESL